MCMVTGCVCQELTVDVTTVDPSTVRRLLRSTRLALMLALGGGILIRDGAELFCNR